MNGCDYVLHLEETTGAEDEYGVRATTICPVGKHVTITIFATAAKHTANEPFCHETITENVAGYTGLTAKNTTNGKIDINGTITGITVDKKSPTGAPLPGRNDQHGHAHPRHDGRRQERSRRGDIDIALRNR